MVGGGPAGLELAIRLGERGHRVRIWEREHALGGQLRLAAAAPDNAALGEYLEFQQERLVQLGIEIELGRTATVDSIVAARPDAVAIATGARARRLEVPGADAPFVIEGRELLAGRATPGRRVALIAMEDHQQPLAIAHWLVARGHELEIVYASAAVAPLVGKYSIGAILGRISSGGARFRVMERVVAIEPGRLHTRNIFSGAAATVDGFDSVVLACGGTAEAALYAPVRALIPDTHILGDAYAPRRLWFATRQAHALAMAL
ncbi:MAG: FAD-dependent oxidoreductase [Steroidobacteraceae bacterium]